VPRRRLRLPCSWSTTLPALSAFAASCLLAGAAPAQAQGTASAPATANPFAVTRSLPPPAADTVELKFAEFFRTPVGPRGLEPTPRLLALDGRRVRLVGYMAQQEAPTPGLLILTALPVPIAEIEDGMADDLPASVVFVHADPGQAAAEPILFMPGLLQFTGTLAVGPREEADGRVSLVRLQLDAEPTQALVQLGRRAAAANAFALLQARAAGAVR